MPPLNDVPKGPGSGPFGAPGSTTASLLRRAVSSAVDKAVRIMWTARPIASSRSTALHPAHQEPGEDDQEEGRQGQGHTRQPLGAHGVHVPVAERAGQAPSEARPKEIT